MRIEFINKYLGLPVACFVCAALLCTCTASKQDLGLRNQHGCDCERLSALAQREYRKMQEVSAVKQITRRPRGRLGRVRKWTGAHRRRRISHIVDCPEW